MIVDLDLFPLNIDWGTRGGPKFSTTIVQTDSGAVVAIQKWSQSLGQWEVSFSVQTEAQLLTLQTFFQARAGMARGFLFLDPLDNQAVTEPIGTGDGTTVNFQLQKTYSSGGASTVRTITKPNTGSVLVYNNGVLVTGVTVNASSGVVTLPAAPASGHSVTWSGQFYVPVRFLSDVASMTIDGILGGWDRVQLGEILQ